MAVSIQSESKEYTLKDRAMVALAIVSFGWVIFALDVETYAVAVNMEVESTRAFIGDENTDVVVKRAKFLFESARQYVPERLINPPTDESSVETFLAKTDEFNWLDKQMSSIWQKVLIMVYQMFYRLCLLQYWAITMMPIVLAMLIEGSLSRKIKMYEFKQSSAVKQQLWMRGIVFFVFMINIYMLLPFATGFGQYYPPIILFLLGYVGKNTIEHVTKTL